jgi:two-component system response regulator HydG
MNYRIEDSQSDTNKCSSFGASKTASGKSLRWLANPKGRMQTVVQHINQVADSPLTVLIEGESGTGKELVARAIHGLSSRAQKPFLAVDCGAIPESLLESELFGYQRGAFTGAFQGKAGQFLIAEGGTIFLDEIGNLPCGLQPKLLRVLQERQVQPLGNERLISINVRVITATNARLINEVKAGRFRRDLYYRLNEFVITLPLLREREDILDLANEFLEEAGKELGRPGRTISDEAAQVLLRHTWPGNVRELRNVIRRAVLVTADVIRPEDLSIAFPPVSPAVASSAELMPSGLSLREIGAAAVSSAEQHAIEWALRTTGGNKSEAARILHTDYKTLYVKLKHYGITGASLCDARD